MNTISVSSVISVIFVAFCGFTMDFLSCVRKFTSTEPWGEGSMSVVSAGIDWEEESSGVLNLFAAQTWIKAVLGKMHK